jgi:hypothetical protein
MARKYLVQPRGGTNPIDVVNEDGATVEVSVLQFRTKRIADVVADELNRAYEEGQRNPTTGGQVLDNRANSMVP